MTDETNDPIISAQNDDPEDALAADHAPDAPSPARTGRRLTRRLLLVGASLLVSAASVIALIVIDAQHRADNSDGQRYIAMSDFAGDWVQLLLSIPDDPVTGSKQMDEMKARTVNPLHDLFERQMARYFQDYALLDGEPLHVTSASFLDSGTTRQAHPTAPGTTTVLITTSVSPSRAGRGNSFWVDVVGRGSSYAVSDFGTTS
jgi:hypothetical protein